jgi:VanZ family protein
VKPSRAGLTLRIVLAWLPVCAYTGLIWFLSSRVLDVKLDSIPFRDKGVHFVEYGVLGFLMTHAVRVTWPRARRALSAAFWLTVSLGLIDELHQAYVPGRSADTLDLATDALGALIAITLYHLLAGLIRRRLQTRLALQPPHERSSEESLP